MIQKNILRGSNNYIKEIKIKLLAYLPETFERHMK